MDTLMQKTIANSNSTALFGSGMAAQAVVDAGASIDSHFEIITKTPELVKVELLKGLKCTIGRTGGGGLSAKYHGVTPSDIVTDTNYLAPLKKIKLFCDNENLKDFGYFVPRFVPRPKMRGLKYIDKNKIPENLRDKNYFCMSVLGNLTVLQKLGYLDFPVNISDDVIFKLGNIDCDNLVVQPVFSKLGTFFPAKYVSNSMIYYRPVYLEEVDIDFSKRLFSIQGFNTKLILEKLFCSFYLKYGLHLMKPIKWEVFAQYNIKQAYILNKEKVYAHPKVQMELNFARHELFNIVQEMHPNITSSNFRYFNGIHLSYDRKILENVGQGIEVIDTSISRGLGYHPTIEMYCKVYKRYAI